MCVAQVHGWLSMTVDDITTFVRNGLEEGDKTFYVADFSLPQQWTMQTLESNRNVFLSLVG